MMAFSKQKKTFLSLSKGALKRLRSVFEHTGYTDKGVLEALGIKNISTIKESDKHLLMKYTAQGRAIDTLIRLFLIEVPCTIDSVILAIKPLELETLSDAGLIEVNSHFIQGAIKLLPFQGLLLGFDRSPQLYKPLQQDYVMGVGSSSLTLANLTIRKPAHQILDLGTGCGIQAFLAAQHSEKVFAVDRNPRAIQFAAFNAGLNGLSNVKCLEGDRFEPVKQEKFDHVISNPPFVISPDMRFIYRDSGMDADQFCQKIIKEVPQYLTNNGYCQILCNWIEYAHQDWRDRLRIWFNDTGCDAWILRSETKNTEVYANTWIQHTEKNEPDTFDEHFEQWMAYYDKLGIKAISAGLITMRKRDSHDNWFYADDSPEKMLGPCGEYLVQGFESRDFLSSVQDDSQLLGSRLILSHDARLTSQAKPSSQGWMNETMHLTLTRGLAHTVNIDPYVAQMLINCDGKHLLSELLFKMSQSLGMDQEKIRPHLYPIVRGLIEKGFLKPSPLE